MDLRQKLKDVILSNLVFENENRIGVEIESLIYDQKNARLSINSGVDYSGTDLIEDLEKERDTNKARDIYSLEPGGQLEWASQPQKSLFEINDQFQRHVERLSTQLKKKDLFSIDLSLEPLYAPDEIELIKHKKYELMNDLFKKTGSLGPWMMRNSTSTQINLDFTDQREAEEMAFISDCIQPLAAILFSNVPYKNSQKTGNENSRYNIWLDTDPARCGSLLSHGIESPKGLINKFCDIVINAPAIFIPDNNEEMHAFNGTLGAWMSSHNKDLSEKTVAQSALHQNFTHIRFKQVIEIRGCDRPPFGYELAPAAFWTGILLDRKTREKALEKVSAWTIEERKELEERARFTDMDVTGPGKVEIGKWINLFIEYALNGLSTRGVGLEKDESIFLKPFVEKFRKQGTMSLHYQAKFDTIEKLFDQYK